MSESDPVIESFYALRGAEFGFLEQFELRQSVDPQIWSGFNLKITLRSSASSNSQQLLLAFDGVKSLRIGDLTGLVRYMIEVHSIAASQLEGANYEVTEGEYSAFSFLCDTFTAQIQ